MGSRTGSARRRECEQRRTLTTCRRRTEPGLPVGGSELQWGPQVQGRREQGVARRTGVAGSFQARSHVTGRRPRLRAQEQVSQPRSHLARSAAPGLSRVPWGQKALKKGPSLLLLRQWPWGLKWGGPHFTEQDAEA